MDSGATYVLLAILLFVLAMFLFWKLDKIRPGGSLVSLVAFVLFALSYIPVEDSRVLNGVFGMFRLIGIAGLIAATITALRHRAKSRDAPDVETKPAPQAQANPNKCPQCGLVNRTVDSSCKRCGAQLQSGK
jgi:uncharacterized paraquat-inducible protein A